MAGMFYLIGFGLAGFSGYSDLNWVFIFISSLFTVIGEFIMLAHAIDIDDGAFAKSKRFLHKIIIHSVFTAPIYFIATMFN